MGSVGSIENIGSWQGATPFEDDLFESNAKSMDLTIYEDKKLNREYVILNKSIKLYHNTSEDAWKSIQKQGLIPNDRKGKQHLGVYLTGGTEDLRGWRKGSVLLEVIIPKGTRLYQDAQPNALFVTNKIPVSRIRRL